jgi:hypothetical protein
MAKRRRRFEDLESNVRHPGLRTEPLRGKSNRSLLLYSREPSPIPRLVQASDLHRGQSIKRLVADGQRNFGNGRTPKARQCRTFS